VQGLATQINTTPSTGTPSRYGTRCSFDRTCSLAQQAIAMQAMTGTAGGGGYIHQSSAVRLNELSVTYNIPTVWTQRLLRGSSASVTLAGRNLALWTNYPGADPDVNTQSTLNDVTTDNGLGLSQPRNWVLRLNLGF
jgi:hypothetical protein